jgi:hypothetical protein
MLNKKTLNINDDELFDLFKKRCKEQGASMAGIARILIIEWLKQQGGQDDTL